MFIAILLGLGMNRDIPSIVNIHKDDIGVAANGTILDVPLMDSFSQI
jgi:hypothetical protein